jgi:hypothetical protein
LTPGRIVRLRINNTAPGTWIAIVPILSAPTRRDRYVCTSCGAYWAMARRVPVMPRNPASERMSGCVGGREMRR